MKNTNLNTKTQATWCPGCFNFQVLAGVKNAIEKQIQEGKKEDWAIASPVSVCS